ncbi:MAG: hemolysin III family protein [Anaerolineae bacterium]
MTILERWFLEPANTITHLAGAVGALVGTVVLTTLTRDDPDKMLSMLVYGVSMVLLYAASALLHGVKSSSAVRMWLNRFDHAAIFLLIAGTYTPIAYNLFPAPWQWRVLAAVWSVGLIGALIKLMSRRIHGMLNTSIYVVLGWGGAVPLLFAADLVTLIPVSGLLLILFGGLIYTAGFLVYCFQWPDPWPGVLGHHEIWHIFVMAGSLAHFLFILRYVAPFSPTAV